MLPSTTRMRRSGGPRPLGRRFDVVGGPPWIRLCRRATLSKRPAALSDFQSLPRALTWWPGVRSALSVPIRSRGGVMGALRFESERPFAFDQEDQTVLANVGEQIGHGGMGIVFAAFDPELRRDVAVKLLASRHRAADGGMWRNRMAAEARARQSIRKE